MNNEINNKISDDYILIENDFEVESTHYISDFFLDLYNIIIEIFTLPNDLSVIKY